MATLLKSWTTYWLSTGTSTWNHWYDAKGRVKIYLESQNTANNTSYIRIDHYIIFDSIDGITASSTSSYRCNIGSYGGTYQTKNGYDDVSSGGHTEFIGSTYHTVTHNANGTGTLYFNGSLTATLTEKYDGNSFTATKSSSSTVALPTIPRYATITAFTNDSITATSFHFNVSANVSIDYIQHSLNGGAWTDSGSQTISGLSPGTQYSLRCRVRRADSGLWTESGYIYITTLSPATITSFTWAKASGAAGLSTLTCGWSANASCDAVEYSLNGGGWTSSGTSGTSGSFNVGGLTPNVQYSLKIRVKRTDSQVWTESGTIYATTYDIAKITVAPNNNVNIENNASITYTNPSGASLQISLYKTDAMTPIAYYRPCTGTNYEFVFTSGEKNTFYSQIPNSKTLPLRFHLRTSDGLGNIWLHSVERTFEVFNANPTFTLAMIGYADQNSVSLALTGSNKKIIKGISNLLFTIQPMTANKGATPVSYQINSGSISNTGSHTGSAITILLNAVDAGNASITAIDSRGKTTTVSLTYSQFIDYSAPSIESINVRRQGGVTENLLFDVVGLFNNWSGLATSNSIQSIQYRYKEKGTSTWSSYISLTGLSYDGNEYSITDVLGTGDLFDISTEYDVEIKVTDRLSYDTIEIPINSGEPYIWKDLLNKYLGIGKKPTVTLDVAGDINSDGDYYKNGELFVVDDLLSTSPTNALSANMGRELNEKKQDKLLVVDDLLSDSPTNALSANMGRVLSESCIGTVLYNNPSGTNGNVTLSDNVSNYEYIEIFYKSSDGYYNSCKIYSPNGKTANLFGFNMDGNVYLKMALAVISGTSVTFSANKEWYKASNTSTGGYNASGNYIYITRVVGYK